MNSSHTQTDLEQLTTFEQLSQRCHEQAVELHQHKQLIGRLYEQLRCSNNKQTKTEYHLQLLSALLENLRQQDTLKVTEETHSNRLADAYENPDSAAQAKDVGGQLVKQVKTERGCVVAIDVGRTHLHLQGLILENQALLSEIKQLRDLNAQLERRLSRQEHRLSSVAAELQTTWGLVARLKQEHAELHTAESVLRYELREKRCLLSRLRGELESSRQYAELARELRDESELEWHALRREFDYRKQVKVQQMDASKNEVYSTKESFEINKTKIVKNNACETENKTSPASALSPWSDGAELMAKRLYSLESECHQLFVQLASTVERQASLGSKLERIHLRHTTASKDTRFLANSSDDITYLVLNQNQTNFGKDDLLPESVALARTSLATDSETGETQDASTRMLEGVIAAEMRDVAGNSKPITLAVARQRFWVEQNSGLATVPALLGHQLAAEPAHAADTECAPVAAVMAASESLSFPSLSSQLSLTHEKADGDGKEPASWEEDEAWNASDCGEISRLTSTILKEIVVFLEYTGKDVAAAPDVGFLPICFPMNSLAGSIKSDKDSGRKAVGGDASIMASVSCRLLSLLPVCMVYIRQQWEELAGKIAQLQINYERVKAKVERLREERREEQRHGHEEITKYEFERRAQEFKTSLT